MSLVGGANVRFTDALQVDADVVITDSVATFAGPLNVNGGLSIAGGNAVLEITGANQVGQNVLLTDGATLTHSAGAANVQLTVAGDFMIAAGSQVDVTGRGYGSGDGPGRGDHPSFAGVGGGAGYGGNGGVSSQGAAGGVGYGSLTGPMDLGSGGGVGVDKDGGSGGGSLWLVVGGMLTIDGAIKANGTPGLGHANSGGGGGAGGSLYLTIGSLMGSGSVFANGGDGGDANAGGGGGGRIAIYYTESSYSGTFSAIGGSGYQRGGAGTILLKRNADMGPRIILDAGGTSTAALTTVSGVTQWPSLSLIGGANVRFTDALQVTGDLAISNGGASFAQSLNVDGEVTIFNSAVVSGGPITIGQNLALTGGSTVMEIAGANQVGLNVSLTDGATLTHTAGAANVQVTAGGDFTIAAGGQIDISGKGYEPASGPGKGGQAGIYGGSGGGAGYGGAGGNGSETAGGVTYGSMTEPVDLGSGGGWDVSMDAGSGGGAIRLMVGGTLTVQGAIIANGGDGMGRWNAGDGGGSGGSVYLTVGGLAGSGTISANGGNGGHSSAGGGGGGRIALYYAAYHYTGAISVDGGVGYQQGGTGTVYTPPKDWELVLDKQLFGRLETAWSVDRWIFPGIAGQQLGLQQINTSAPSIVFDLNGPNGWSGFSDLTSPTLVNLPSSGSYTLVARGTGGAQNKTYSFRLEEAVPTALSLGTTYNGAFIGSGQAQWFRVDLADSVLMQVVLENAATGNQNELYVRFGAPPTRSTYDYRFDATASANQRIGVSNPYAGAWYILVYGDLINTSSPYTLKVTAKDILLNKLTPSRHGNTTQAELTLEGGGFDSGTQMALIASSGDQIQASTLDIQSSTRLTATFPAHALPIGIYSVRVSKPGGDSDTLANAFEIVEGGIPKLETKLIVPSSLGYHTTATIYVEYANRGDGAMPAPLLVVTATQKGRQAAFLTLHNVGLLGGFWTSADPVGFSHSVQILASGEVPGTLQPGESFRVPVYYAGWQQPWDSWYSPFEFNLGVLTADNTGATDWSSLKADMKPASISAEAWEPLWASFLAQVGTTWGGYVTMLDDNASYLGRLGQRVVDIGQLLAFEFLQADGLSPLQSLAGAIDAAVEAPGLPLMFTRSFGSTISQRFESGSLGRGWSHNWQYSLEQASDGTVTVLGPGGSRRTFQPDSRSSGTYFSQLGDYAKLTTTGNGVFALQEPAGLLRAFRSDGKLDYVQDPNGNRITCGYSGNLLIGLTHSSGQFLSIAYNGAWQIQSITDPVGRQTVFSYDATGEHLTAIESYDARTTTYAYAGTGAQQHALTVITFPDGTHRTLSYDLHGRLTGTARDGNAEAVTFANDKGKVTATDALGNVSMFYFDQRGLLIKTEDALGNAVGLSFDDNYNLIRLTDPAGRSYKYGYDSKGNLVPSTDPLGQTTRFIYTGSFNRLASVTDANTNLTQFAYTAAGNLQSITYADGSHEGWAYDSIGNVTAWTNRRGSVINYTCDAAGRMTSKAYADGSRAVYVYDNRGNLTSASTLDPQQSTLELLSYAYDSNDRMTRITYLDGKFLAFTYDSAARRASSEDQLGHRLEYHYDAVGRLQNVTNERAEPVVSYSYDPVGRLSRKDLGNGVYTTYDYDSTGQLLYLVNLKQDNFVLARFDYSYDTRGRRTAIDTLDGRWTYEYDDLGQLTHAVFSSTSPDLPSQDLAYHYDPLGNRIRTIENGVTTEYATDKLNQYVHVGSKNYAFDADGNLTQETTIQSTTIYAYDEENRLVRVESPQGVWQYSYDALGNRMATTGYDEMRRFVIDPIGLGNIVGEYDSSGNLLAHNDYGLGLLSRTGAGEDPVYYTFDTMGNAQQLVTVAGVIANAYAYAPFGALLRRTEAIPNPFQFMAELGVINSANGENLTRVRSFAPSLGRFLQADPEGIGNGVNLSIYSLNNPVTFVDPLGLKLTEWQHRDIAYRWSAAVHGLWYGKYNSGGNKETELLGIGDLRVGWVDLADRGAKIHDILNYLGVPGAEHIVSDWYGRKLRDRIFTGDLPSDEEMRYIGNFRIAASLHLLDKDIVAGRWRALSSARMSELLNALRKAMRDDEAFVKVAGEFVKASDPNQKTGPAGFGPSRFISPDGLQVYRIDFENEASASAPAQQVVITDPLNANLDQTSFQWTEVGWGDQLIVVPPNSQHFETTVPVSCQGTDFEVQVELGLRSASGQAYAIFRSVDPTMGLPPAVEIGFLPPEDGTGRGMGHVAYTINAKPGLATGTEIRNVASISFDNQPGIATNQRDPHNPADGTDPAKECLNTIDSGSPTSQVVVLPPTVNRNDFPVDWAGQDDPLGSGIASYDIYVKGGDGPWTLWKDRTPDTSATYVGQSGHRYAFYSVARDNVGNEEAAPITADTQTQVLILPTLSDIAEQTTDENTPTAAIAITLGDTEAPAAELTLTGSSSVPALVPDSGIVFGGAGTDRTVTITPVTHQSGTVTITVRVTAADGRSLSQSFQLTVNTANHPPAVTLPGPIAANKQTATSVTGLQVSDVDAGTGNVTVMLSASHGTVVLSASVPGGLAAGQITGNGTASVIATAPMAAINATLGAGSGLVYTGNLNFVGSDTLVIEANDNGHTGAGGAKTVTAAVAITVEGTLHDSWLIQHFTEADLSDVSKEADVWGPNADPDHDGRNNLMEFALGSDPNNGADLSDGLTTSVVDDGGQHLTLTFHRRKSDPSLVYLPEVSGDGVAWGSGAGQLGVPTDLNAEFEQVTFKDLTPIAPGSPRFFRLRVVKND